MDADHKQILETLEEAEKTIATLKAFIQGQATPTTDTAKPLRLEQPRNSSGSVVSSESSSYFSQPYMTLSATTLFENRGIEVFRLPDTVGLYFIIPNTKVCTVARSAVRSPCLIAEEYQDGFHRPAFVQVGEWVYPLMPGSMVYRSEYKYYLFPDLNSTSPGTSVGVILPKSCSDEQRDQFEQLLLGFVGLEEFPSHPPDSFGKSTDLILNARTSVQLIKTNSGVYSQRSSQFRTTPQIQEIREGGASTSAGGGAGASNDCQGSYGRCYIQSYFSDPGPNNMLNNIVG